jgi:hypothetical protein
MAPWSTTAALKVRGDQLPAHEGSASKSSIGSRFNEVGTREWGIALYFFPLDAQVALRLSDLDVEVCCLALVLRHLAHVTDQ